MANMNRYISDRSLALAPSPLHEMRLSPGAREVVNLAQGYPDFDPPEFIKEAAVQAIRGGHNQYATNWGARKLRAAIAEKVRWYNDIAADAERDITVTCGSTEGMLSALMAVVNPGDEVIIFQPYYETYVTDAVVAGATPVFVTLHAPEFTFDADALAAAFSPATKAIIINTPHNPTGKVFSAGELAIIAELCRRHDVLAITDEIYEHILFDGHRHLSIASLPGMAERTITVSGLSKTYSVTGWRLGYTIAPTEISLAMRRVHNFLTVGAPAPLQTAAVTALQVERDYYTTLADEYRARRDLLLPALRRHGFNVFEPEGAYISGGDIRRDGTGRPSLQRIPAPRNRRGRRSG